MAVNLNNTTNKAVARTRGRGLRARLGVGLLSLGLAGGMGVAMSAQPASASTMSSGGVKVVLDVPARPVPGYGGPVVTLGVSWS